MHASQNWKDIYLLSLLFFHLEFFIYIIQIVIFLYMLFTWKFCYLIFVFVFCLSYISFELLCCELHHFIIFHCLPSQIWLYIFYTLLFLFIFKCYWYYLNVISPISLRFSFVLKFPMFAQSLFEFSQISCTVCKVCLHSYWKMGLQHELVFTLKHLLQLTHKLILVIWIHLLYIMNLLAVSGHANIEISCFYYYPLYAELRKDVTNII